MSNIDQNQLLTPQIGNINLSFNSGSVKSDEIMGEDEIEQMILSQVQKVTPPAIPQPQIQPQPGLEPTPTEVPKIEQPEPEPKEEEEEAEEITEPATPEMVIIDFDIESMNNNLNAITTDAKKRILDLDRKQKLLDSRIGLIEKFILLDEKDLAKELVKEKVNLTSVGQIQKSIVNRTELLSQILDISLKYEDTIIKWNKTMMDIEKDKVSAYQKVKSLTKEVKVMDGDINSVLNTINDFVKMNPSIAEDAKNELKIKGYGGAAFN